MVDKDKMIEQRLREMNLAHAEMIKEYGFYTHVVGSDSDYPFGFNMHTHGLPDSFDHPDLQIVYPIHPPMLNGFLHVLVDWIKKGNTIEAGKNYDFILDKYDVLFTWATENERDVLRMILPDAQGNLESSKIDTKYRDQWKDTYDKPKGLGYR